MPFETIARWSDDMELICARISQRYSPFKILLKTKDDPEMLESWISHHSRITGFGGLVIFDNMSTDPRVEAIYDKYASAVAIYRYAGFHNLIHHTDSFPALYAALRESCDHFAFLDTDEHLTLFDGAERFQADSTIVSFLHERGSANVFPGTWLQNISGYTDHFSLYDSQIPLNHGLKWGKPILSSAAAFHGMINHNTQVDHALYLQPLITNFFVLHLSRVSRQQRINANLQKLRSYDAIGENCDLEEFLTMDVSALKSEQVRMYAREIHELTDLDCSPIGPLTGWIRVSDTGSLSYSLAWQRDTLKRFVTNPEDFVSAMLSK